MKYIGFARMEFSILPNRPSSGTLRSFGCQNRFQTPQITLETSFGEIWENLSKLPFLRFWPKPTDSEGLVRAKIGKNRKFQIFPKSPKNTCLDQK